MTFDLAHADLAGELGGGGAVSLQREGTVQRLLVAAPHLGEGELLGGGDRGENITSKTQEKKTSCRKRAEHQSEINKQKVLYLIIIKTYMIIIVIITIIICLN